MLDTIYRNKKVLITGHTGFKGSWLALWLLKLGAKVAGYSAYTPSVPANFDVCELSDKLHHIEGDVRDAVQLAEAFATFQPDYVFHLAAQPIVRTAYELPKLTFDTNVGGTVNLLEAIRRTESVQAAVLITSDKCYENVEWEYGYREDDRLGGKDPYSASKAAAEIAISTYARSFFGKKAFSETESPCLIASARAGNVIGGGDWARDRIVPDCVRAWANDETPDIRSPHATRPWQHVMEPLSGYLCLMAALAEERAGRLNLRDESLHGKSFNFGPSESVNESVGELVTAMGQIWDNKTWNNCSDPATIQKEAGLLKLNCDRARYFLDWEATLSMDEAIEMTTRWYMAYYGGVQNMYDYTQNQLEQYEALSAQRNQSLRYHEAGTESPCPPHNMLQPERPEIKV